MLINCPVCQAINVLPTPTFPLHEGGKFNVQHLCNKCSSIFEYKAQMTIVRDANAVKETRSSLSES